MSVICGVFNFSEQGYYKWLRTPISQKEIRNHEIYLKVVEIHEKHPEAGYRGIFDYIIFDKSFNSEDVTEYKIRSICESNNIQSNLKRKRNQYGKYADSKTDCGDLVKRNFYAPAPNLLWFVDIIEHPTNEGKLYYCSIKDAFSRKIVGHAFGDNRKADLLCRAVKDALKKRGYPSGAIIHSDRGGQMRSDDYVQLLKENKLVRSMGNAHTCADNAAKESFFGRLQECVLDQRKVWLTRQELRQCIRLWVENDYNTILRNRTTKMTPDQMEIHFKEHPEKYKISNQGFANLTNKFISAIIRLVRVS